MNHDLATQVTLAQVKPGMYARTTPTPRKEKGGLFLVDSEHPRISNGKARKVTQNVSEKGVGRYLLFEDATRTSPRNGTAMIWVYKTGPDGLPPTEPTYPKCPTCGSTEPGCRTKDGAWAPIMHAGRKKLMQAPKAVAKRKVEPKCPVCTSVDDVCYDTGTGQPAPAWHQGRVDLKDHANGNSRAADVIDASYVGDGKRVHKDPNGTVWIEGWTGGEGEHVTKEGWRVHVTHTGLVTVLGAAETHVSRASKAAVVTPLDLHATDEEADEAMDREADDGPATQRCDKCKGFGLVRKRGANAGDKYKTMNGALQAKGNGNAVECPRCHGNGELAAAA